MPTSAKKLTAEERAKLQALDKDLAQLEKDTDSLLRQMTAVEERAKLQLAQQRINKLTKKGSQT